jgi:hypothetical protein
VNVIVAHNSVGQVGKLFGASILSSAHFNGKLDFIINNSLQLLMANLKQLLSLVNLFLNFVFRKQTINGVFQFSGERIGFLLI